LRVTAPRQTILDLAPSLTEQALERLVSEALAQRLVRDLPAVGALRPLLDAGPKRTRSELERHFLAVVRAAGLPEPETNARFAGLEVDALWREARLAVELDSWQFHGHRLAFERDREKEQRLQAAGLTVRRVTDRQLQRPLQVVARLAATLGATS
jgi:very-short-patch-repair endonuclease